MNDNELKKPSRRVESFNFLTNDNELKKPSRREEGFNFLINRSEAFVVEYIFLTNVSEKRHHC